MTGIVAHTYPEWWLKLTGQAAHWSTDYSSDFQISGFAISGHKNIQNLAKSVTVE